MRTVDVVQPTQSCAEPQGSLPPSDLAGAIARWQQVYRRLRTRRALLRLNDAQLADIGLTRAEANREAQRPFWTLL